MSNLLGLRPHAMGSSVDPLSWTGVRKVTDMASDESETRFDCVDLSRHDSTFDRTIVDSIDVGLPVMLGWNTEDYGCHAVLVTGYWIGKEKWLTLRDPGGSDAISWDSLKAQQAGNGKFEVGLCMQHVGPRPLKSVTKDDEPVVYQWMPTQEYESVKDLFAGEAKDEDGAVA